MKLFLIKFRSIDNEKEVYDKLFELADGRSFLPLDSTTFILMADRTKKFVRQSLVFELESNILLVDISENHAEDFFIDNNFDHTHLQSFVEEYHNERDKYNSTSNESFSELNTLLDKVSQHGIDELTGLEKKRLDELAN